MKRFHVHVHVADLGASVGFYSKLFAAAPARLEADYAKWMLDDPRINFAISTRGSEPGIDHLGFQTDDAAELAELKARAQAADIALLDEGATTCCYARSDKHWVTDPQGIAWEQFHTLHDVPVFGHGKVAPAGASTPASTPASSAAAEPAPACCANTPAGDATARNAGCAPRGKPVGVAVKSATSSCC